MILHHGSYYYCENCNGQRSIKVRKSSTIAAIGQDPGKVVWTAPGGRKNSQSIWAPELHRIGGRWFIYYAADDGRNANHRMWVLEGLTDDPQGTYQCCGHLNTSGWAIDGTPLILEDGRMFFIWSGWPGKRDGLQNLYIAAMSDPATIAGQRHFLCKPDQSWERHGMPICEGPQVLQRNGSVFVVYSASASWTAEYCLGMLSLRNGEPLNARSWRKHTRPAFAQTDHVWGLGHCSFVKSPCLTQDWMLYHSKSQRAHGWEDRDVHAKQFTWTAEGFPEFGTPPPRAAAMLTPMAIHEPDSLISLHPLAIPGAEKSLTLNPAHV
jgi:GH43 family beta-xylosidase